MDHPSNHATQKQIPVPCGLQSWKDESLELESEDDDGVNVLKEFLRRRIEEEEIPESELPKDIKLFTAENSLTSNIKADVDRLLDKSNDRHKKMKEEADKLNIYNLDKTTFLNVLQRLSYELSRDSPKEEVIVDLLFYLSEVLLREILQRNPKLEPLRELLFWSLEFVRKKLSQWVEEHGGWALVLKAAADAVKDNLGTIAAVTLAVGAAAVIGFGLLKMFAGQKDRREKR